MWTLNPICIVESLDLDTGKVMPLNHEQGEQIEGLPATFRVVPVGKWFDTPLFDQAAQIAAQMFANEGAIVPVKFDETDVLVQEYPKDAKLVFIFHKMIKGKEMLYPYTWSLPPEMIAELKTTGKWELDPTEIN